jgi:ribonucleoside-diphosphate reductase beta chain
MTIHTWLSHEHRGLFFAAFAYVYFFRSKGLLHGLAADTNWVFRDESCHLGFAFEVVKLVPSQQPDLWDADLEKDIVAMLREAVDAEAQFDPVTIVK